MKPVLTRSFYKYCSLYCSLVFKSEAMADAKNLDADMLDLYGEKIRRINCSMNQHFTVYHSSDLSESVNLISRLRSDDNLIAAVMREHAPRVIPDLQRQVDNLAFGMGLETMGIINHGNVVFTTVVDLADVWFESEYITPIRYASRGTYMAMGKLLKPIDETEATRMALMGINILATATERYPKEIVDVMGDTTRHITYQGVSSKNY